MDRLKLDDFTKYKFLSGIKYASDEKNACFIVHKSDVEENKYKSNLWLYKSEENKYLKLTSFDEEKMFIWLDDGEHILFPGVRNSKDKEKLKSGEVFTQFYKINIHGGEAQEAFRIPKRVTAIKQLDDNSFIFTATYNENKKEIDLLPEEEKAKYLKEQKEERDYEVFEEIPFWVNGLGFTNKDRNPLYLYYVKENKYELLTDKNISINNLNINKEKSKIVFIAGSFEGKMELKNNIYLYDIKAKEMSKLKTPLTLVHAFVDFINEDTIIYIGKDMKKYGLNENSKFYTYDISTQENKCITPDLDASITNSIGSDCRYGISYSAGIQKYGEYVYFLTTERENAPLNRIDINGNIEKIISPFGSIDQFSIGSENIIFTGLIDGKLQEIYKRTEEKIEQLTCFNQCFIDEKTISTPEKLTVETAVEVHIDGWVMKPVNFEEGKKYPAILNIHGGPKTAYSDVFYHEMQYWANEGYVVFYCNPRGSDGKGDEFADIRGKYGSIDYNDIMKFTDEVLKRYSFIDENRIGVTGGSYGGFMTNWIVGHTQRFKAAATQRSISNWTSMFATSDIGYFFTDDQALSNPWNNYEKLWENSPLKYANQVKTPTLIIHSDEDYRCWLVEGMQFFTALKYHGVESRMCMFKGENHELSRSGKPKHRIRRLKEITEWFNRFLK